MVYFEREVPTFGMVPCDFRRNYGIYWKSSRRECRVPFNMKNNAFFFKEHVVCPSDASQPATLRSVLRSLIF